MRINGPTVVSEIIDQEVVIVNLDKGNYYSLLNTGIPIWEAIAQGLSRQEITEKILLSYEGNTEEITKSVNGFIEILQKEELIIIDPHESSTNHDSSFATNTTAHKLPFKIPILEKYTDMQDLLLLDPIHEVADAGWPNTNP